MSHLTVSEIIDVSEVLTVSIIGAMMMALIMETVSISETLGKFVQDYTAQHPKRQSSSSYLPLQNMKPHL
jgi:hypothetical protein